MGSQDVGFFTGTFPVKMVLVVRIQTRASQVALVVKEHACRCRRHKRCRFDPWVVKIPWRRRMATHSSIPSSDIPWTEQPSGLQSMGVTEQSGTVSMHTYINKYPDHTLFQVSSSHQIESETTDINIRGFQTSLVDQVSKEEDKGSIPHQATKSLHCNS